MFGQNAGHARIVVQSSTWGPDEGSRGASGDDMGLVFYELKASGVEC